MIKTKSIKIWTILTHAFIIIGMGHGILTMGIGEIIWLATLFNDSRSTDGGDVSSSTLYLVALMSLIGQIFIVISTYIKLKTADTVLHLIGLFLLWSALFTYAYGIRNDNYSHLAIVTCFPFVYISIRTLLAGNIVKLCRGSLK